MESNQTRVSKVTVARLHNCGNYEHVRYEIAVDLANGSDAAAVLVDLESILNDLKPVRTDYDYELRRAREVLAKPAADLSETEYSNMQIYRERIRKADEEIEKRRYAITRLNALGGSSQFVDAKDQWDDADRF